jgi:hypothetical protein
LDYVEFGAGPYSVGPALIDKALILAAQEEFGA